MAYGVIYVITNTVNGKQYVGQTTRTLAVRWYYHIRSSRDGSTGALPHAILKHSAEAFKIEQIDIASSLEELNKKEAHYILQLKTLAPYGYNLTSGGEGFKVSEETKQKISKAGAGRAVSIETRRKQRKAQVGKLVSVETRRKLSEAQKKRMSSPEGRKRQSEALLGHVVSSETRLKQSKVRLSKPKATHCRRGHLLDEVNTYIHSSGKRRCWTCAYLQQKRNLPNRLKSYLISADVAPSP